MTDRNTPAKSDTSALAVVTGGPLAKVKELIMAVPDAEDDPTARMMHFILNAPPEDWGGLWEKLPNVKDNVGRGFRAHALRVRDSDFEGRLGVYLIVDIDWLDTGESGLLAVSSEMAMVQLLALHRDGKLPADLQIVAKDKPTKAGFRPIHLHYLNKDQVAAGDPTKVVSEQ